MNANSQEVRELIGDILRYMQITGMPEKDKWVKFTVSLLLEESGEILYVAPMMEPVPVQQVEVINPMSDIDKIVDQL